MSSLFGVVFCDYLTVTVPKDEHDFLMGELSPILDELCCESPASGVYLCPLGGMLKVGTRNVVAWFQATGGFMSSLRDAGLLDTYLSAFGTRPHRVTRLDATLDMPDDPRPILRRLYDAGKSGDLRLTRKRVDPSQLHFETRPALYDPAGSDTGTVYIGRRTAELRVKAYDKRNERIDRTGVDPGVNTIRYEVTGTSKMGVSLRDVVMPAGFFYHYVSPAILQAPEGVPEWRPFTDGGYGLPKTVSLPYQRLRRRVESSRELARLCQLAADCGPEGFKIFVGLIQKYHKPPPTEPSNGDSGG